MSVDRQVCVVSLKTDMSHERSRLSTVGEQGFPSPSSHDKTDCPSCGQRQLTTVSVDGELRISVCGGCNRSYGIDDSTDAESLALLRQDEELCRDFQISAVTCDKCRNNDINHAKVVELVEGRHAQRLRVGSGCGGQGQEIENSMEEVGSTTLLLVDEDFRCARCANDDVDRFDVVESPRPDRLSVKCLDCSSVTDIPLKDCEYEGPADGTWAVEVLGSRECRDEDDDGGSLCDDGDSWCVVDSKENHDVRGWKDAGVNTRPLYSRRCGSNEPNSFQKNFDAAASGNLSVTTRQCDRQNVAESTIEVECWNCRNNIKEQFERQVDGCGRITRWRCYLCGARWNLPDQPSLGKELELKKLPKLPGQPSSRKKPGSEKLPDPSEASGQLERLQPATDTSADWTKVADLRHIKRGDHVARRKWYGVWHHAIVVDVPDAGQTLTVVHYNGGLPRLNGHFASVRRETIDVDPTKEDVYRVDYPAADRCPVEAVIQRACERLGEAKYNPLTNNCEHLARWCKTGRAECGQVRKFRLACQNTILGQVLIPVPFIGGYIGYKYEIGSRIGYRRNNKLDAKKQ